MRIWQEYDSMTMGIKVWQAATVTENQTCALEILAWFLACQSLATNQKLSDWGMSAFLRI
jgi:hypothetical protein